MIAHHKSPTTPLPIEIRVHFLGGGGLHSFHNVPYDTSELCLPQCPSHRLGTAPHVGQYGRSLPTCADKKACSVGDRSEKKWRNWGETHQDKKKRKNLVPTLRQLVDIQNQTDQLLTHVMWFKVFDKRLLLCWEIHASSASLYFFSNVLQPPSVCVCACCVCMCAPCL